VQEA